MMIQKTINIEVDVADYIDNYGMDPYGDGRPVKQAIETDIEQALLDMPDILPVIMEVTIE